jgi:hypothetical protein
MSHCEGYTSFSLFSLVRECKVCIDVHKVCVTEYVSTQKLKEIVKPHIYKDCIDVCKERVIEFSDSRYQEG